MDFVLVFSVVSLIVSVSALIIFLRRLGRGEISLVIREAARPYIHFPRKSQDVVLSQNPWHVVPGQASESGMGLSVKSKVSFTATSFWGVSDQAITEVLHTSERNDSADQRQLLQRALNNDCHQQNVMLIDASPGCHAIDLKAPSELRHTARVPLVLLLTASSHSAVDTGTDVVAMAVHLLYDPSQSLLSISSQWVVSREGKACQLKLFNSGIPSYGDSLSKCVVCHVGETKHALLPCRHIAVCDGCSVRVGACPVCRTPIETQLNVISQSV